ncbi:MAG: methyltransferase domain-containing protein [Rubrivivax sp.]|nr:methyltransferase domain-containing protein [Rubrivivax sp.]
MTPELEALRLSDWYPDDGRQVGVDFASPAQVARYDASQRSTDAAAATLLDELGLRPGQAMADFGCGTGVLVCQAALKGCTAHAVDISAAMLQATLERARALGATGVVPQQAGFLGFQLPAASLDLATTQYALHHLDDVWKGVALQRLHAVLKPGGTLLLRDVVYSCEPAALKATLDDWLQWMQAERGYSRDENLTHVRDEHSTFDWILQGLIERAGFRIEQARHARGVYATYFCRRPA